MHVQRQALVMCNCGASRALLGTFLQSDYYVPVYICGGGRARTAVVKSIVCFDLFLPMYVLTPFGYACFNPFMTI
jgi:hypothetical protein